MHHPLHTPICDTFGIEYPIFLAGMGGVATAPLTAAVSNAGGLGIMGAATMDPDKLRDEIRRTRELTDKPFAVDLLAPIPDMIRPQIEVIFAEGVETFVAGLAVPSEFIDEMHERNMKVVVMCGKVRHAQKSEAGGAEKRRSSRRELPFGRGAILQIGGRVHIVGLGDLSEGGAFLVTRASASVGETHLLRLSMVSRRVEVTLPCEVVRVVDRPAERGMGVVFTELTSYSKDLIEQVLTRRILPGKAEKP